MKIAVIGDVHWSKFSSIVRSRGTKYSTRLEHLIKSLNWCEELADKHMTDMMVYLGDFFDRADLNAEEVTALKEIGWNYQPHYFIVGNHELGLNANDFNTTELFSLLPTATIVNNETVIKDNNGKDIAFIPYYLESNRPELPTASVIFSHNDLQMQYGPYKSEIGYDLNDIANHCSLFVNGHLHNHYIDGNIINLGNICGQNFNEDAFKYGHYMMILDTDTMQYELLENPYAIKFVKIDNDLVNVDENTVVSVKCPFNEVERYKQWYSNALDKRFVLERSAVVGDVEDEEMVVKLDTVDHLAKFREYIQTTLGTDKLIMEELNEVLA